MICSANEVMTVASKAAHGGGASAGAAALFGKAALCHVMAGRDLDDLSRALGALPEGPVATMPLLIAQTLEAASGAAPSRGLPRGSDTALLQSYAEALPYFGTVEDVSDTHVNLRLDPSQPAARRTASRVTLPDALYAQMATLAARRLVPDSAASRAAGAGAGLSDND